MSLKKFASPVEIRNSNSDFRLARMGQLYSERKGEPDSPHRHEFFTVIIIDKASGKHFIDFRSYELGNDQVYFISPGQVHQIIEDQEPCGYVITFSNDFLIKNNIPGSFVDELDLFRDYGDSPPLKLSAKEKEKLMNYCEQICEYSTYEDKYSHQAVGSLIKLILITCNKACEHQEPNPQVIESGHSILKAYRKLIDDNFRIWHQTTKYAEYLSITPDHLNRTIKNLTGRTAKEYLQSRITTEAKRLLYFTDFTVKEIAFELGFSEVANFSSFFRNCTGTTPTEFRNER
jgi:AraC-like DNA-binding protein